MLEWRVASRSFRGGGGVHEVSLTVGAGEIVALVGLIFVKGQWRATWGAAEGVRI